MVALADPHARVREESERGRLTRLDLAGILEHGGVGRAPGHEHLWVGFGVGIRV